VPTLAAIRELIDSEPLVAEVKQVTGRNAGRYRFVEAEIVLRTQDLLKSQQVQAHIEEQIRQQVSNVERVLIHAEPLRRTHLRYAVPLADPAGSISAHFGEAPYFALAKVRLADKWAEEQEILANPYARLEKGKGLRVAEWLVQQKVDVVLMAEDLQGKGPAYVFGDAGVDVLQTSARTLAEAIESTSPAWEKDGA
jgi:predicted Fe-Mo cluster-binding NifX family protein